MTITTKLGELKRRERELLTDRAEVCERVEADRAELGEGIELKDHERESAALSRITANQLRLSAIDAQLAKIGAAIEEETDRTRTERIRGADAAARAAYAEAEQGLRELDELMLTTIRSLMPMIEAQAQRNRRAGDLEREADTMAGRRIKNIPRMADDLTRAVPGALGRMQQLYELATIGSVRSGQARDREPHALADRLAAAAATAGEHS